MVNQLNILCRGRGTGGIPLFPNIQEPRRRKKIFSEIPSGRSEKLQGDQAKGRHPIFWTVFRYLFLP